MTSLIYVNSVYFQQWKSDWEIAFPNSSSDSKLGFLSVGFRLYFEFFSNSQKDCKMGFLNITLIELLNFSQFIKDMENWDFWVLA